MTFKEQLKLAKQYCDDALGILYMTKDVDAEYDHYDSEVQTIFLKENPDTVIRIEFHMIRNLEKKIQQDINKRWTIGILIEEAPNFLTPEELRELEKTI
jgi:hypothetical protein